MSATQTTTGKLYDGRTINIHRGYEYYIPINQRVGHVLNTYYPDIIYEQLKRKIIKVIKHNNLHEQSFIIYR